VRDRFLGQVSDLPANKIGLNYQVQLINQICYDSYIKTRGGITNVTSDFDKVLPPLPLNGSTAGQYYFTQSNGQVGTPQNAGVVLTSDSPAVYTLTTDDIGREVYFMTDTTYQNVLIVAYEETCSGNYFLLDSECPQLVASNVAFVHDKLNGLWYNSLHDCYIIHLGTHLYYYKPGGTFQWNEIYVVGSNLVRNIYSIIRDYGQDVAIIAGDCYKINFDSNNVSTVYYKFNYDPDVNVMALGSHLYDLPAFYQLNTVGIRRRYMYTLTRQSGTAPINNDRTSLTLQQETAAPQNGTSGLDYLEEGSANATGVASQYQTLVCSIVANLANFVQGTSYWFGFTDGSGATRNVIFNFNKTSTDAGNQISDVYNSLLTPFNKIFPDVRVTYNTAYIIFTYLTGTSYQLSTPVGSGYTDCSTASYLTTGTTSIQVVQANKAFNSATNEKDPFTHVSIYSTEDYKKDVNNNFSGGDPNSFAWLNDIPLMKAGRGIIANIGGVLTIYNTPGTNDGEGTFSNLDLYRTIFVVYVVSGVSYALATRITGIVNANTAQLYTFSNPSTIGITVNQAFYSIDANYLAILNGFSSSLYVNSLYKYTETTIYPTPITPENTSAVNGQFSNGRQVFLSNGNIGVVKDTYSALYNIYDLIVATDKGTSTVAAINNKGFSYSDSMTSEEISPRIGTKAILTRFMMGLPKSDLNCNVGEVIPGFLVIVNGVNYYYSETPNDLYYIGGNYNPFHQKDTMQGKITAISKHPDCFALFTAIKTAQVTTNLQLDFTDVANNYTVRSLPPPNIVDERFGTGNDVAINGSIGWNIWGHIGSHSSEYVYRQNTGMAEICHMSGGNYGVIVNTGDVYVFNGTTYGESYLNNKIRLLVKELTKRTIDLDDRYGFLIRGLDASFKPKMYYAATETSIIVGQGEFQSVPILSFFVHFIKNNETTYMPSMEMFFSGTTRTAYTMISILGNIFNWMYDQQTDDFAAIPCFHDGVDAEIVSSQTTSDDTGTSQHFYLKHLEGHVYTDPDVAYRSGFKLAITAENDIGTPVTAASSVSSNDDINYDLDVVGNRLRYKLAFNTAGWLMTGIVNYYRAQDKKTYANSGDLDVAGQLAVQSNIILGLSRYVSPMNIATGTVLTTVNSLGTPTAPDYTRVTGPDGVVGSAYAFGSFGNTGFFIPAITFGTDQWVLTFWAKATLGTPNASVLFGISQNGHPVNNLNMEIIGGNYFQMRFSKWNGSSLDYSIPMFHITDTNWHFYRITCEIAYSVVASSVDLISDAFGTMPVANGLFSIPTIMIPDGFSIFDLRLFNAYKNDADLVYYYNDVLTGGKRTLPTV
jgi:hypothetical protein